MFKQSILTVLFTSTFALAQGTLYIPDNLPAAGTCNAAPFGAAAMTYVGRIPASFLDATQRRILDVQFTPCATATFAAPTMQMGFGHVPTPIANPFTFPTFDAGGNITSLGSFLDYTPAWNSVTNGPFSFVATANTWSPMGYAAPGGTNFVWNGTNDIAFYMTFSGATGTGSFHRTSTEPFRLYTSGTYQATTSSTTGASGTKMSLITTWEPVCTGCGPVTISMTGTSSLGGSLTPVIANVGAGIPFVGIGFGPFCATPLCNQCPIGHGWQSVNFGTTATLSIPNNPLFTGTQVGFQGAGLLTAGGCAAPMVSLSPTLVAQVN